MKIIEFILNNSIVLFLVCFLVSLSAALPFLYHKMIVSEYQSLKKFILSIGQILLTQIGIFLFLMVGITFLLAG